MSAPTPPPTTDQIRDAWDAIAPRFDEHTTPRSMAFGEAVLNRVELGAGVRFLDVGAGSGALAIPAARRGADVVAVDIAPAMVEQLVARARQEGLTLDGRVMDGEALVELGDDTFDAAASLNGVSLLPDLQAGLREVVRVTRPGGHVLIATFGAPERAEFIAFPMAAIAAAVPGFVSPLQQRPLPFQLADPDTFRRELADAGLADITIDVLSWDSSFDSAAELWDVVTSSNPIGAQLAAGLTDDQRQTALEVLEGMLRERSGGQPRAVLTTEMNVGVGTV